MKLGLVTDSTSDLPADLAADRGIAVVPAVLVIDGRSYVDGRGISREAFYNRLPGMTTLPTTASPSIGEFVETYRRLLGEGCDHVLSVHAAGKLTTIADVAQMAAADLDGRITVLESGSLSLGLGFQMLAAADAADQGLGLEAALAAVRSVRGRTRVVAALDTMEYLRRSGRVSAKATWSRWAPSAPRARRTSACATSCSASGRSSDWPSCTPTRKAAPAGCWTRSSGPGAARSRARS
jgi:DegV family protein with EDD domain